MCITSAEPRVFCLDPVSPHGGRLPGPLNPAFPVPRVPIRVEFPKGARQDGPVVAGYLDHPIRSEPVDVVSRRCGSVDVYENPYGVHSPRRGTSARQGGPREFDVEGDRTEVRLDPETDDVDVRVGHAARGHRLRCDARPIVELSVNLNRMNGSFAPRC